VVSPAFLTRVKVTIEKDPKTRDRTTGTINLWLKGIKSRAVAEKTGDVEYYLEVVLN